MMWRDVMHGAKQHIGTRLICSACAAQTSRSIVSWQLSVTTPDSLAGTVNSPRYSTQILLVPVNEGKEWKHFMLSWSGMWCNDAACIYLILKHVGHCQQVLSRMAWLSKTCRGHNTPTAGPFKLSDVRVAPAKRSNCVRYILTYNT